MQRFAGPQVEARVMPGTAHRVVDNEPFDKGTVIVGAKGADREDVGSPTRQQHRLVADMAKQLAVISEFGEPQFPAPDRGRPARLDLRPFLLLRLSFDGPVAPGEMSDFNNKETNAWRVEPNLRPNPAGARNMLPGGFHQGAQPERRSDGGAKACSGARAVACKQDQSRTGVSPCH